MFGAAGREAATIEEKAGKNKNQTKEHLFSNNKCIIKQYPQF